MEKMEHCFIDKETYMRNLEKLFDSGVLNDGIIAKMESNYASVYPIAAAIYERETSWFITGNSDPEKNRAARRKCNFYKSFI